MPPSDSNSENEPSQPTTGRFAPARPRDKILGVVIGSSLALIIMGLAFWFLDQPTR